MKKKLSVVHIGIHYNPNRGGGNLRNSRLIEELAEIDNDLNMTIISYCYKDISKDFDVPKNVNLVFIESALKQVLFLIKFALSNKVDIVHCHNPRVFFFASLFFPRKIFIELHSLQELAGMKASLFKLTLPLSNKIIVLGKQGKELLKKTFGVRDEKIQVLTNGFVQKKIETPVQKTLSDKLMISYIGSFYDWQGVFNFVEAVKIFAEKYSTERVDFYMIGAGQEFENVKKMAADLNVEHLITFTGQVAPTEIDNYWRSTDIVVIPRPSTQATESTVPLKLVDAFSFGKIIVTSDVKGVTELIEHDYNGVVYPHSEIDKLADTWNLLLNDELKRKELSDNAMTYCKSLPSWKQVAQTLYDLYLEYK